MTKRLRLMACTVIIVILMSASFPIAANYFTNLTVDSRTMLDLSSGRVSGADAQYFFDFSSLPVSWAAGVVVERDIIGGNSPVVERLRFYVRSIVRPQRDQLEPLFAIYVICRSALNCESEIPFGIELVNRSRDFVFAVRYGTNGFTNTIDETYYNLKLAPMSTAIRMRQFISLPPSQMIEHQNTAFIYGMPMNSQIYRDGIAFIQLREAVEMMGFRVYWYAPTYTVTIQRGAMIDSFQITANTTHIHGNIPARLINGRTYVAVSYFTTVLGNRFSLDPRGNNIWIA